MWASVFETEFQEKRADAIFKGDTSEALYHIFLIESSDWEYIFSPDIQEIMDRFSMHRQGIYSFGRDYDLLPNWWAECLSLLNAEESKAIKARRRINGSK